MYPKLNSFHRIKNTITLYKMKTLKIVYFHLMAFICVSVQGSCVITRNLPFLVLLIFYVH